MKFLACFSPSTPQIQGEPLGSTVKVLRYADGRIIGATGGPVLAPGGVVVYGEDLLPEIKLRWVSTPDEDCEYRRVAFEITTVATGEKVLAHWERRAHVDIAGQGYLFLATSPLISPAGCGESGNWVLIRDGFLHPIGDGG
jgi:hypothetical protein